MNILISVNEKYLDKAETMLFSLKRNTKEPIDVYLLNSSLSQDHILRFEQYLEKKSGMTLTVIDIEPALFDSFPVSARFSIEIYYRILAQFILPVELDRILWLDADIIVVKDIGAFYHQPFGGMKYVVCPEKEYPGEYDLWKARMQKERLGLPDEHIYFNSGVMLMNLALLRKETKRDEILHKCLELKDALQFPDQDLLNAIYSGQVKYAEWKLFNYELLGVKRLPKEDAERVSILHYTGLYKPWDYHCMNNVSKYYWKTRWAQGHRLETAKCYALAIRYLTLNYFSDVKNLLF